MPIGSHCKKYPEGSLEYHLCRAYKKSGYLDKYGGSVIITVLTSIVFMIVLGYFYVKSHIKEIRGNWAEQRCHPVILPFAGLINAPEGQSAADYAGENMLRCVTSILEDIAQVALLPITYVQGATKISIGNLGINLDFLREIMAYIRKIFEEIVSDIMGKTFNIVLAVRKIMMKLHDTLRKVEGFSATLVYIAISCMYAVFAFFWIFILVMFEVVVYYLLMGVWYLVAFFAPVPWVWDFMNLIWMIYDFLHAIAVLIPLIIVVINVDRISDMTSSDPRCFAADTMVRTIKGEKAIQNIKTGDILADGGAVTATFKLSTRDQTLYCLDGILVTGAHTVHHAEKGYIPVSEHPASREITSYSRPYVYCINTTTKLIYIKDHIFLDWDEVDEADITQLGRIAKKHLLKIAKPADIHKYMDGGFVGATLIKLEDGREIPIKDIIVNDRLWSGETVMGTVEIDTSAIDSIKRFKLKGKHFTGGPNLRTNDKDLGIQSTLDVAGVRVGTPDRLYHIITDSKSLTVNGIRFFDYNGALEPILWNQPDNITKSALF